MTRAFLLADSEVTRNQYQQFIDNPNCEKPNGWDGSFVDYSPTEQHPVQNVSWFDAVLFCNWLSHKEGLASCYEWKGAIGNWHLIPEANGYRLPTEAEWEYASRAGTVTTFSHGDDESLLGRYAVHFANQLELPGSKLPNGWGLFDVGGNVWEWCDDWHGPFGSQTTVTDPVGPIQGNERVFRGGSISNNVRFTRLDYRNARHPDNRFNLIGFRVARTLP